VRIAREAGDTDSTIFALQVLGLALAGGGAYDEAARIFEEAGRFGRDYGIGPFLARATAISAGFHLDVFDYEGHAAIAEEACALVKEYKGSYSGEHGDGLVRSEWIEPVECCIGMGGIIADGADEVRKATRENLRHDVDQIKIMASGGAMSPGDELDTTQYTVEEMRAAVEEARAVGKYVLAHAYSGSAIRNAIQAGVRCIEHGNLLDEAGAQAIKAAGAYLVPTMVTYEAISREGKNYGIGEHQIQKINLALEKSLEGLTHAYRAGCKIGSGSDLLGDMQAQRTMEFELKGQVMKPMEVLRSATMVNAEIFRMADRIGSVEPGKYADLLVVDGNPLTNLRIFQSSAHIQAIVKGGAFVKRAL